MEFDRRSLDFEGRPLLYEQLTLKFEGRPLEFDGRPLTFEVAALGLEFGGRPLQCEGRPRSIDFYVPKYADVCSEIVDFTFQMTSICHSENVPSTVREPQLGL